MRLVDNNQSEQNYTDFSYLEFKLRLVIWITSKGNTNKTQIPIPLEKCELSLFINKIDLLQTDKTTQIEKFFEIDYMCPLSYTTFSISPNQFENGHAYLDFSLNLKTPIFLMTAMILI